MRRQRDIYEPMCETSEPGERLISREDLQATSFDIGQRILSLFGYQKLSNIFFRLRMNSDELTAVIDGEQMPSVEMLLGIQTLTGASIDWILTGKGSKSLPSQNLMIRPPENAMFPIRVQPPQNTRIPQLW